MKYLSVWYFDAGEAHPRHCSDRSCPPYNAGADRGRALPSLTRGRHLVFPLPSLMVMACAITSIRALLRFSERMANATSRWGRVCCSCAQVSPLPLAKHTQLEQQSGNTPVAKLTTIGIPNPHHNRPLRMYPDVHIQNTRVTPLT